MAQKHYPSYEAYYKALEAAGHKLIRTENGKINFWVHDFGNHNGPGCEICNLSWCHHCQTNFEPCKGVSKKSAKKKQYTFSFSQINESSVTVEAKGEEEAERKAIKAWEQGYGKEPRIRGFEVDGKWTKWDR